MLNTTPLNTTPLNQPAQAVEIDSPELPLALALWGDGQPELPLGLRVVFGVGQPELSLALALEGEGQPELPLGLKLVNGSGQPALPLKLGQLAEGQPELPLALTIVYGTGQPELPLALGWEQPEGQPELPLALTLYADGQPELPLGLEVVAASGQPELPLALSAYADGQPELPLALTAHAGGVASVPAPVAGYGAGLWQARVLLDGVDVSARLTGTITVEAEESAARVAEFALLPAGGALNPWTYVAAGVTIEHQWDGGPWLPLFRGVVETPDYNPVTRVLSMRCTDDRQGVLNGLSRAQIDAIIATGRWSAAVFDEADVGLVYAENRISTTSAALDLDRNRVPRVTPWAAKAQADHEYTDAHLIDETLSLDLAGRSQIHNTSALTFQYRYPRLKRRAWQFRWDHPDNSLNLILADNPTFPTRDMVLAAINGTGWTARVISIRELPPAQWYQFVLGSWAYWGIDEDVRANLVWGVSAVLDTRYAQDVTESWSATVSAPDSVAQLGEIKDEATANLAVVFDTAAWEADPEADPVVPAPQTAFHSLTGENSVDVTDQDADGRTVAENAFETLVAKAQTEILAAHRATRVSATVPLDALLELAHTVRINTSVLAAKGKVVKVAHKMDIDAGTADTELAIAVSTVNASGLVATTPPAPPIAPEKPVTTSADPQRLSDVGSTLMNDGSTPVTDSMIANVKNGFIGNKETALQAGATAITPEFKVTVPEIPAEDRDPLALNAEPQTFNIAIPEDELAIAA